MKFKYKPTITRDPALWYAWRPVKVSDNEFAWLEPVYRYKSDRRGQWSNKYRSRVTYMSKEEFTTRALKYGSIQEHEYAMDGAEEREIVSAQTAAPKMK